MHFSAEQCFDQRFEPTPILDGVVIPRLDRGLNLGDLEIRKVETSCGHIESWIPGGLLLAAYGAPFEFDSLLFVGV